MTAPLDLLDLDALAQRGGAADPRRRPPARRRPGPPARRRLVRGRPGAGPRAGPGVRQARPARHAPDRLRLRRRLRRRVRAGLPGAGGRRLRRPLAWSRVQGSLAMYAIWRYGSEEQKQRWLPADGGRRGDRLLRPDRARPRLRPGVDGHPGPPRRRRLGAHRRQDVDHQRAGRRRRGDLGAHRRRACAVSLVPMDTPGRDAPARSGTSCRCARRRPARSCSTTSGCRPTPSCPRRSGSRRR